MQLPNLKSSVRGNTSGLGVELLPSGLKALCLQRQYGVLRISETRSFPLSEEDAVPSVDPRRALQRFAAAQHAQSCTVGLAAMASNTLISSMPVTMKKEAIEDFVQGQVQSIGSLSEDDFLYDYQTEPYLSADKQNIVITLARSDAIEGCCGLLERCQLRSRQVTSRILALASAFCALQPAAAFHPVPQLLLELEEDATALVVLCNGSVLYANWLNCGTHTVQSEDGLQILREELASSQARWKETLPGGNENFQPRDIWVTGADNAMEDFLSQLSSVYPDRIIRILGIPGDWLPQSDSLLHTDLTILYGLALQSLHESQFHLALLPERLKWLEQKEKAYPYLLSAFLLLLFGLLAWFGGTLYHLNRECHSAETELQNLRQCAKIIPDMEKLHEKILFQQKRMLPIVEAASRTSRYMEALQLWQNAQKTGETEEKSFGVFFADEFTFAHENRSAATKEETKEDTAQRTASPHAGLFDPIPASAEQPQQTYPLKQIPVENIKTLQNIFIGGIAPLGQFRYKIVKDMQTQLVDSGAYVNVDDHTDFLGERFLGSYLLPWQNFLKDNRDALGMEYTTYFFQLPFRETFIDSSLLNQGKRR